MGTKSTVSNSCSYRAVIININSNSNKKNNNNKNNVRQWVARRVVALVCVCVCACGKRCAQQQQPKQAFTYAWACICARVQRKKMRVVSLQQYSVDYLWQARELGNLHIQIQLCATDESASQTARNSLPLICGYVCVSVCVALMVDTTPHQRALTNWDSKTLFSARCGMKKCVCGTYTRIAAQLIKS